MSKYELYQGDCLSILPKLKTPVKCIFADPPDNLGLAYDAYDDSLPEELYVAKLEQWLRLFVAKAPIVWFSFNARWTPAVGNILYRMSRERRNLNLHSTCCGVPELEVKPCVQVFTFGQHRKSDLGNNHRPLWRIRNTALGDLYPDQIKVPSWRQRNGDKRAAEGGRVPGDVFDMQYPDPGYCRVGSWLSGALDDPNACDKFKADVEAWFQTCPGDVFDFPRVTGNSKQRHDWHPTQLHEDLVRRCLLLSTRPDDRVLDPFAGTGTALRVCREIGRPCTLIELDRTYCDLIAKDAGNGLKRRQIKPSKRRSGGGLEFTALLK